MTAGSEELAALADEARVLGRPDLRSAALVELGLARGRRNYDKRHAIAERDAAREAAKAMSPKGR